jgi:hypothetical protein
MKLLSFKNIRILLLLTLLAFVAIYTKQQRIYSTSWLEPLEVVIFPINADDSDETANYIAGLSDSSFADIDTFTAREAKRYSLYQDRPTVTTLGPTINNLPPTPPPQNGFVLKIALWSLKFRYWAWQNPPNSYSNDNMVKIFVLYHSPGLEITVPNSLGLEKGLLGLVNGIASKEQSKQNNIVIAHELLHTVGATDKYDSSGNPIFPHGYAQPDRKPLLPQYRAEIMAGRIPKSSSSTEMAQSLKSCVIGAKTAREISWLEIQ